jgi:plastocyanin
MKKMSLVFSASLFLAAAGSANAGVKGTTSFTGKAPAAEAIDMTSDPKCKSMNAKATTDDVVIKDGKLANVFVFVKNAPAGEHKAPATKVTLDQKGCMYNPKMFGIMVGQDLEIVNSDPTLHNVHAYAKPGEFNQAMPKQGQKMTKKFKKKQTLVDIKCDVHKWMHASAGVVDHPFFAVSSDKGEFNIDGLPDGEYDVDAIHPKLGTKSGKVKVAGGNGTVDFAFGG